MNEATILEGAIIEALAFYAFAAVTVLAGLMVITARNPVHSVLFLILSFFSSAALFIMMGAEFLAMILIIVYVGAVAVLFLFVVMMLNIDFVRLREGFWQYAPFGGLVGIILLAELLMIIASRTFSRGDGAALTPIPDPGAVTNTDALGQILYTHYIYAFQGAGLILLVAMIGAIVLTHRHRKGVKKQIIADQVARTSEETMEVVEVQPGQGI